MMYKQRLFAAALLGAALLIAGCSHNMERVLLPPEAPMDGIAKIAVVGFTNVSTDPGIGLLFEQYVTAQLAESGRYTVVDGYTARAALARLKLSIDELAYPPAAQELGRELGVDALIAGTATYYFDDVRMGVPSCVNCNVEGRSPYWSVHQTSQAIATFQGRVIRVQDGAIIWSSVAEGRDSTVRTISIDWHSSDSPPESLVPRSDRADIPKNREAAVRDAAADFTEELLPRYAWVRVE